MMQYLFAFLVGGAFCALGEVLILCTKLTPARILVGDVVGGVILGALGIYQPLLEFAGAGAGVPLTGFGCLLAEGVKKAVDTNGWIGAFTGGFTACSGGVCAAIVFGFLSALVFRAKPEGKRKKGNFALYKP